MTIGLDANQANPEVTVNQMTKGYGTADIAGGASVTLTDYEATWGMLELTGAVTSAIAVIVSTTANRLFVFNNTTGGYAVEVKTSGTSGISIPAGAKDFLYCDGSTILQHLPSNVTTAPASTVSSAIAAFGDATGNMVFSTNWKLVADNLNGADKQLQQVDLKDYSEVAVSAATSTIDLTQGNYQNKTISGATSLTFANPSPSGSACRLTLELTNASSLVTWPAAVKWPGGSAPTLTGTGTDVLQFITRDAGTTWNGVLVMGDLS